jgi:hypothetical protein
VVADRRAILVSHVTRSVRGRELDPGPAEPRRRGRGAGPARRAADDHPRRRARGAASRRSRGHPRPLVHCASGGGDCRESTLRRSDARSTTSSPEDLTWTRGGRPQHAHDAMIAAICVTVICRSAPATRTSSPGSTISSWSTYRTPTTDGGDHLGVRGGRGRAGAVRGVPSAGCGARPLAVVSRVDRGRGRGRTRGS